MSEYKVINAAVILLLELIGKFHNPLILTFPLPLAHQWSKHNRLMHEDDQWEWKGEDERIVKFANELQKENEGSIDYFIFGHFHRRTHMNLSQGGEMFILGEWINEYDYIMFDGSECYSRNIE